jgi:hypothetical protein
MKNEIKRLEAIEFFLIPSDSGKPYQIYAIQYGNRYKFENISDNIINILFAKLLDYPHILRRCNIANQDKRSIIEHVILQFWSKADSQLDIDDDGKFHFENIDYDDLKSFLLMSCNNAIKDLHKEEHDLSMRRLQVQRMIGVKYIAINNDGTSESSSRNFKYPTTVYGHQIFQILEDEIIKLHPHFKEVHVLCYSYKRYSKLNEYKAECLQNKPFASISRKAHSLGCREE